MKYISFAIPCYNSAEYMEHAIESILKGGEDVEIIIVNDGSKDKTLEIARRYEKQYPTIVKAIDKENGGHGDAVNTGLQHATGLYFKVVDSDDWVDESSLMKILDTLHTLVDNDKMIDMYQMNKIPNRRLRAYMTNYLAIMMTVSSIIAIRSKNPQNLEKKRELWQYLAKKDLWLYRKIRYGILGQTMNLPGKPGRKVSSFAYVVANRFLGFN